MPSSDVRVVLLGRVGCHLCDDAREVVTRVCEPAEVAWRELLVDDDPALEREFGERIPVVFVDGRFVGQWLLDEDELRAALTTAAAGRHTGIPAGD